MLRSPRLWSLVLAVAAAGSAVPLWLARYLPIQDLPQHLAAIRVLHDYSDPRFGFAELFSLQLLHTQYLGYYLLVHALGFLVELELANRLVLTACVVTTPYALRALLRAQGRDERLALLAIPLAYNAHLILGFVSFLLAIPLLLYGLALALRQRRAATRGRGALLALLALGCFYAHVVPFLLLVLGVGLLALQRSARGAAAHLLPLLPASGAALYWAAKSPAGQATVTAALGAQTAHKLKVAPAAIAWHDAPNWLTDVLHGDDDKHLLYAWLALGGAFLLAGVFERRGAPDALARSLSRRLWLLPPACALAYFALPTSYQWIWPIAQRFPLLTLLLAIAVLPSPPRYVAELLVAATLALGAAQTHLIARAFVAFDTQEVQDLDRALAVLPYKARVAGLVFTRGSRHVKFSPFIHYVAYHQARRGGAVMFTFADFPQSPFRFREPDRPPRVPPRWEWLPQAVDPRRDLGWYDYVLARGGPGRIAHQRDAYQPLYRGRAYSVWRRRNAAPKLR